MRRLFLGLAAALTLSACAVDAMSTKPEVRGLEGAAPLQTLYDPAPQTEVVMRPGGKLEIILPSNPSTGYFWQVETEPDEQILTLLDNSYQGDPNPRGAVGVGGDEVFVYEAIMPGKTRLVMRYARSSGPEAETRTFDIRVLK